MCCGCHSSNLSHIFEEGLTSVTLTIDHSDYAAERRDAYHHVLCRPAMARYRFLRSVPLRAFAVRRRGRFVRRHVQAPVGVPTVIRRTMRSTKVSHAGRLPPRAKHQLTLAPVTPARTYPVRGRFTRGVGGTRGDPFPLRGQARRRDYFQNYLVRRAVGIAAQAQRNGGRLTVADTAHNRGAAAVVRRVQAGGRGLPPYARGFFARVQRQRELGDNAAEYLRLSSALSNPPVVSESYGQGRINRRMNITEIAAMFGLRV